MRRSLIAVVITFAVATAHADPPGETPAPPSTTMPTPNLVLDHDPLVKPREFHPLRAELTLTGMYLAFFGWMYVAWYKHHSTSQPYKFGGDDENCDPLHGAAEARCVLLGWAGDTTYAGGEDKFGHAWSTMALARLTDEILEQWGGFGHTESMLIGTGLSWLTFLGVEVRDGFNFEFSYSDLGGDTVGALAALALMQWPRLDEMFDFRVQYFPSAAYVSKLDGSSMCREGTCSRWDIAEDYSGQKYLLAFHLGSIAALRDIPTYGFLSRFVDVAVGFDTRNYKPSDPGATPRQEGFIAVSFNAQGFFDWLLEGGNHETLRKVTHGLGEVFNLPYSSVNLLTVQHSPCATCAVSTDGAL